MIKWLDAVLRSHAHDREEIKHVYQGHQLTIHSHNFIHSFPKPCIIQK